MSLRILLLLLTATSLCSGCDSGEPDPVSEEPEALMTVKEYVQSAEELSLFANVLTLSELADSVDTGAPFTLLAPSDAALRHLTSVFGFSIEEIIANDDLLPLTEFHIVPGSSVAASDVQTDSSLTTRGGRTLTAIRTGVRVGLDADGDGAIDAYITSSNIPVVNGVVHVIDRVLLPYNLALPSMLDAMDDNDALIGFRYLLSLTGDDELLDAMGNVTVFAPTQRAYERLAYSMGMTPRDFFENPPPFVLEGLGLHIAPGFSVNRADLSAGDSYPTLAPEFNVCLVESGTGTLGIQNFGFGLEPPARFTGPQITTRQGIVHPIDAILLQYNPAEELCP